MSNSSKITSIWDILGAFYAEEGSRFLGSMNLGRQWQSTNPAQAEFITKFMPHLPQVEQLISEELMKTIASSICSDVNEFFAENNLPGVELEDIGSDGVLYFGSIYEQLIMWQTAGEEDRLYMQNGKVKPAARMEEGASVTY